MSDNPRQFSSLDNGDRGMGETLTNRPRTAAPVSEPEDFAKLVEFERRLKQIQQANGTYVEKTTEAERAYEAEQKAARDRAFREAVKQAQADKELNAQREQASRTELLKRIQGEQRQLSPIATESDVNKARRLSGLPAIDDLPSGGAATASRQPPPSTGSTPPTPNGTAARASALVEPTAHPAPAALKEAIGNAVGGIGQTLPKALPQAAGRLLIPGVGAGLILAGALIAGQSVQQAVATTAVVTASGYAGGLIGTAVGGPIGYYVGSLVGGFVGGYLANALFPAQLPSTAAHQEAVPTPLYVPFSGGQSPGALYYVRIAYPGANGSTSYSLSTPILGVITAFAAVAGLDGVWTSYVTYNNGTQTDSIRNSSTQYGTPYIDSIFRADGHNDYPPPGAGSPLPPQEPRPYYYQPSPANNDVIVPSGTPAAGTNKGKANYVPPSMPSNNVPNGGGVFPGHGGLAPSYTPNPTQTPSNGGGMLPDYAPQPQPMPFLEPQNTPVARDDNRNGVTITQSTGGIAPITYADVTPATITQSTVTRSEGTDAFGNYIPQGAQIPASSFSTPTSTPETKKASPTPDAYSPVPKMQLQPQPKTTEQTATDKTSEVIKQQKKDFDDQIGRMTAIATAIAALTPAINGIPDAIANSPNVRAANKDVVQGAVCEISQPGGCLGAPIKQAEDAAKANGNKLNDILTGLNTAGSAAQLALLDTINGKLGDQLPGGIGGKLSRFADWMHLDRVLNIMILATTIHNGLMLSNDIGQTLLGIINNALTLIGLKKEDGSGFDIGSIISGSIENLIKGAIGMENYQGLSAAWQKANRTYQATTNVLNQLMNVNSVITNALEVIGSYTGKIGNALRIWGVLGEKAYSWMNPQPSFDNQWITKLQQLQQGASTVAMVAQIPVDAVNAVTELNNSATEFVKAVQQEPDTKPGIDVGEAAKVKTEREAAKTASYVPAFDISDLFDADD